MRRGSDKGAAWLRLRVRRGSDLGCGVAQTGCGVAQTRVRRGSDKGAAWLRLRVRRGSDRVWRGSDRVRHGSDKGAAWLRQGCGVARTVACRLAVRQARVRISARHPRGGHLPSGSYEESKSGTGQDIYSI